MQRELKNIGGCLDFWGGIPKPKIDAVDSIPKPKTLPSAADATTFISLLKPFTTASKTAGPGLVI